MTGLQARGRNGKVPGCTPRRSQVTQPSIRHIQRCQANDMSIVEQYQGNTKIPLKDGVDQLHRYFPIEQVQAFKSFSLSSGLDTATNTVGNATNIVALATKTSVAVAKL